MIHSVAELRWKKRVIIVVGSDRNEVEQQLGKLLPHAGELDERDLVVIVADQREVRTVHGVILVSDHSADLFERFEIPDDESFATLLVGKDGTEKWRSHTPANWPTIARIVDAMPMRQAEMR